MKENLKYIFEKSKLPEKSKKILRTWRRMGNKLKGILRIFL